MQPLNHEQYIQRCLQLALRGNGSVSPNPMVGAVLVHEGRIIGEGWHEKYGQAHAEVNCLRSVKDEDRHLITGSTMYVSLEPCAHFGNTPPCAHRIVQEGIRNVVICNTDPFEQVSGKGISILRSAGIAVTTGVMESAGLWVNRRFFCYHQQKRPYIILKWAQTADGYIAPTDKSPLQITNPQSNQLVHKWRTEEDAIMVGYQTATTDNPQLTARHWQGKNPLRIVIDRNLTLPPSLKLFDNETETWVLNAGKEKAGDTTAFVQLDFSRDIIPQLLDRLYAARKLSLIVEGGAVLLQSFINAGLWDEARVFTGPDTIHSGLDAPRLAQHSHMSRNAIAGDMLDIYTRIGTIFPYVTGLDL